MNQAYEDIRSKITEPPLWWDEEGVPRYWPFKAELVADIYATEAALVEVHCQGCKRRFDVAFSDGPTRAIERYDPVVQHASLADLIRSRELHYGDPPDIGCCFGGPTMNSEPRRVIEFWSRSLHALEGWKRDPVLEIDITPDWVTVG